MRKKEVYPLVLTSANGSGGGMMQKKQKVFGASVEAARRYYSVTKYFRRGAPNVFFPIIPPDLDFKFADADNTWIAYSSDPLKETIKRYSKDHKDQKDEKNDDFLRIATSWKNKEPRLLVISVDVTEGKTVTFDSYYRKTQDLDNSLYDADGITIDHIMASGTVPIFYKYRDIPKEPGRKFCDDGILSNTPFRELLKAHRDYWKRIVGEDQDKIPDLDVYIINVHPSKYRTDPDTSKLGTVPTDLDGVKDRINDMIFSDRDSQKIYWQNPVQSPSKTHICKIFLSEWHPRNACLLL